MSAVMSAVNPMAAEGKQTVMDVLKRDQENFFRLVEDPASHAGNSPSTASRSISCSCSSAR